MAQGHTLDISNAEAGHKAHKHRKRNIALGTVIVLALGLLGVRIYLPVWVTDYVNKTLDNIPGYSGSISDVDLALYRGAYIIYDLKLDKKANGDIPAPFLDIKKIDLSIQWGALFKGAVVGDVTLTSPTINFATGRSGATTQTGVETDWTKPIKELMPLDINFVEINDGKIAYKDFSRKPAVDLFIDHLNARATNIRNADDRNVALPSDITARGNSIGGGKFALDGKMNIIKQVPDLDMTSKLEAVDLPAMNDYARAFAGVDFDQGNLNVYADLDVKDGRVSGFVKPLATNIHLIDWDTDEPDVLGVIWESLVSVVLEIFENQQKDQFGTQIALEGNIDNPQTSFWSALNGILRNAFVKAYSDTVKKE